MKKFIYFILPLFAFITALYFFILKKPFNLDEKLQKSTPKWKIYFFMSVLIILSFLQKNTWALKKSENINTDTTNIIKQNALFDTPEWKQLQENWKHIDLSVNLPPGYNKSSDGGHEGISWAWAEENKILWDVLIAKGVVKPQVTKVVNIFFGNFMFHNLRSRGSCYMGFPIHWRKAPTSAKAAKQIKTIILLEEKGNVSSEISAKAIQEAIKELEKLMKYEKDAINEKVEIKDKFIHYLIFEKLYEKNTNSYEPITQEDMSEAVLLIKKLLIEIKDKFVFKKMLDLR